jgi:hypothetical protein
MSPEGATVLVMVPHQKSPVGSAWRMGRAGVSARDTTRLTTRDPAV